MPEVKPFPIPKALWLNAQRIVVEFKNDLMRVEDNYGHAAYREMAIRIQPSAPAFERQQSDIERTYIHEMVHWILHAMGESDLQSNEKFVDTFARLLHQALTMVEDA